MLDVYQKKRVGKQTLLYNAYKTHHDIIPLSDDDEEEDLFQSKTLQSEGGTSNSNTLVDIGMIVKHEKMQNVSNYNTK